MDLSRAADLILVVFIGMLVCCIVSVGHILVYNLSRGHESQTWKQKSAQLIWCAAVFLFARSWLSFVTRFVPEPYLVREIPKLAPLIELIHWKDEVFHVPQAQKYCEGKWFEWDDKITTPPGV